jgi:hypothetical protein
LISTGNITNKNLEALIIPRIATIADAFVTFDYIELTRTALVFHS